jgi:kynurenine formamidase
MDQPEVLERGALSTISSQAILEALRLVRTGKTYDLGVDLGNALPRLPPDQIAPFSLSQFRSPASFAAEPALRGNSFNVEVIQGSLHQSSHIDALIHAQRHGRVYGGGEAAALLGDFGWRAFGAETIPPIVLRGVVIDAAAALGATPVPDGYALSAEQLQAAVQAQGLILKPGDAVLVRTGKITQYMTDRAAFEAGCPGLSAAAARWLMAQGMVLFGLDATSADPHPVPDWDDTVHEELLIRHGIHIIENVNLEALVHDQVREFAFICLPLRIQGATGSWVRPLALT